MGRKKCNKKEYKTTSQVEIITCFMEHSLSDGYSINFNQKPVRKSVEVYALNEDGTLGEKLKYNLSGSRLKLPRYLDENIKVLIKYKKIFIQELNYQKFPPCKVHIQGIDEFGNIKNITFVSDYAVLSRIIEPGEVNESIFNN